MKHRPRRRHAASMPPPVQIAEHRTPEAAAADYLAVSDAPVRANVPAQPAGPSGSDSSRLLVLAAAALVLVAALSMSLLRLLFQLVSPTRGV